MIDLVISFIESRWKPFAIVFAFFIVGFADAKCFLLFQSGDLSQRSLILVGVMNVVTLGYLAWLCVRTSFYIQPRTKAIVFALTACCLGAGIAYFEGL
jgi:hypothetical protein